MFEVDLSSLVDQAEKADAERGGNTDWEKGRYTMEITRAMKYKPKEGKKGIGYGFLWKILEDDYAGQSDWQSLNVNPENETSVSIFIRTLTSLGLDKEFLKTNPPEDQWLSMIEGTVAVVDFENKPWKTDKTKFSREFRVVKLVDVNAPEEESTEDSGEGGIFG